MQADGRHSIAYVWVSSKRGLRSGTSGVRDLCGPQGTFLRTEMRMFLGCENGFFDGGLSGCLPISNRERLLGL